MSKNEYLDSLERALASMPQEERESAIQYYRDYFEDAGAQKEQTVILQLGAPEALAQSILKSLNRGGAASSPDLPAAPSLPDRDQAEEKKEAVNLEKAAPPPEPVHTAPKQPSPNPADAGPAPQPGQGQPGGFQGSPRPQNPNPGMPGAGPAPGPYMTGAGPRPNYGYGAGNPGQAARGQGQNGAYGQPGPGSAQWGQQGAQGMPGASGWGPGNWQARMGGTKRNGRWSTGAIVALVIAAVFLSPVIIGLAGCAVGLLACIFGVLLGCGVVVLAFLGCGLILTVAGILWTFVHPFEGIATLGAGLLSLALGILTLIPFILFCGKVLPKFCGWLYKTISGLFRRKAQTH